LDAEAIEAMLREDRAEWEALVAVLEAHPEGPLHDPKSPAWTSRDVYAHMARWIKHSTAHLEAHLAGREFPKVEGTDDEINARWQHEDSGLSLAEARERARTAFERRIQAIQAVPPDRWDKAVEAIARADGAQHYRGHRKYIVVA
jgi:hypothetical protein